MQNICVGYNRYFCKTGDYFKSAFDWLSCTCHIFQIRGNIFRADWKQNVKTSFTDKFAETFIFHLDYKTRQFVQIICPDLELTEVQHGQIGFNLKFDFTPLTYPFILIFASLSLSQLFFKKMARYLDFSFHL